MINLINVEEPLRNALEIIGQYCKHNDCKTCGLKINDDTCLTEIYPEVWWMYLMADRKTEPQTEGKTMRLIDADALMLIFNDWWYSSFGQEETEQSLTIKEAMKAIEDAPTIDRLQGEWKHLEGDEWVCSNCGYVVWTEGSWEHPLERGKDFCEHCGARM